MTLNKPTKKRWTKNEINTLMIWRSEGVDYDVIAEELDRPAQACRSKASRFSRQNHDA